MIRPPALLPFVVVVALLSTPAFARGPGYYFGVGAYNTPMGEVSRGTSTTPTTLGDTYIMLSASYRFAEEGFGWLPSLSLSPLGRGTTDNAATVRQINLLLPVAYHLGAFDFKLGLGLGFKLFIGNGGTTQLNNGSGTSTFYLPSIFSSTSSWMVDGGFNINFSDRLRLSVDGLVSGLISEKFAFGVMSLLEFAW